MTMCPASKYQTETQYVYNFIQTDVYTEFSPGGKGKILEISGPFHSGLGPRI